jgi:V/A-type H+-transporting ATPase subunit E
MGDVAKITKKISAGSKGEVDKILKEAKSEAKEIISEAEEKAKELKAEIVDGGKRDAEREKQRIVANAKLQARKLKLDAKEDVIKEAFKVAEDHLTKLGSSKEYSSVLASLIKEAQSVVRGDVEILVKQNDSKVLTSDFIKKLSADTKSKIELSSVTIDTIGGAIIKAKDGKTEVNNTIEMRMERMRGDIRPKVAKALFA